MSNQRWRGALMAAVAITSLLFMLPSFVSPPAVREPSPPDQEYIPLVSRPGAVTATVTATAPPPTPLPTPTEVHEIFIPAVSSPSLLEAVYRSGQTFITWDEMADLQGEHYRVYRSAAPITPATLPGADLLAEVGENSARFYTNLYNPRGTTIFQPRYVDRFVTQDGGAPLPTGTGLLVWTLSQADFDGAQNGPGYYAVTVTPAGGQESLDSRYAAGPVSEAAAEPLPVEITPLSPTDAESGRHVYIQYMDLRSWNPTFHAPNTTNQYYGFDPADPGVSSALAYAYDYAVFTPTPEMCGGTLPDQLPVILRLHGWRGNTSSADDGYPDRYCAYGIYPVDVTDTWYFGFARHTDYRRTSEVEENDVIVNYTEQRVLRMVYDLLRDPPGPPVDPQRVYVSGQSMGGTGSLAFAERYPNVFAAAYASQPMTNYLTAGVTTLDWIADVAPKWGRPDLNLPVEIGAPGNWADPLQKYNGAPVWDWQNYLDALTAAKFPDRLGDEMALLTVIHGFTDKVLTYDSQGAPFYPALAVSRRPWAGMVTPNEHEWMYYQGLPPSLAPVGNDRYTYLPFYDFKVIRDETVPGFSNLTSNAAYLPEAPGRYNENIKWSASWESWDGSPVDDADRWQISLCSTNLGARSCGGSLVQTVDVTPRRVQRFQIIPGVEYAWENRQVKDDAVVSRGTVTADIHGLITVQGFQVTPGGNRLVIKPHQ